MAEEGRRLSKYVAAASALAQYLGGIEAWMSKVRTELLSVRRIRSALPFCGEVYVHERWKTMPLARREACIAWLTNLVPLSA